ncbi:hypothetical protein PspLS_09568 [Pyricularia sp. CBS 133598]|nr:hypothetical protein PspLS_09568 [Pyricularia sp. CBS 133598]
MFLFRSRGARLFSPGVQSLYRKAVLPTCPVRTARSRLYTSFQDPPDSGEDNECEPPSEDASKLEHARPVKAVSPDLTGTSAKARRMRARTRTYWTELGYSKLDPCVAATNLSASITQSKPGLIEALKNYEKYLHYIRNVDLDRDLALKILREKLGLPTYQIKRRLTASKKEAEMRILLLSITRQGLLTEDEAMRVREYLDGTAGSMIPQALHANLRLSWAWLLLEAETAKKKKKKKKNEMGPEAETSACVRQDGSSPGAVDDGEVQLLAQALGVLQGAMGADKGVAATNATANARAKNKNKATKPAHLSPLEHLSNLTQSELAAFRDLSAASGKDGPSDTSKSSTEVKKKGKSYSIHYVKADDLELQPIEKPQPPVPGVEYGLDRVLFNPGVYHLQCPRTQVYNFDPYLSKIMPIEEFDFSALKRYVTSSKDQTLIQMASSLGKKYTGSTSSMTASLAHFHYLISGWRSITTKSITRETPIESSNFTRITRAPAAAFLHYKDGTYAIDADKEFDRSTILSMLGKSMEKLLTLPKEEYENYHRDRSHLLSEATREDPEAFHYTTLGDFLMRSQLDAHNPRLPGTGMYDLKTRAVLSIRMESANVKNGLGYEIRKRFGEFESFEREYVDMIRSAFLKYSMQVRMGRMDGIFVAYHNTERIFGFQYIPLEEMDYSIHGTTDRKLGDEEFKLSVTLLNKVLDKATARFPGKTLRLHFETRPSDTPFMYIFAKPVSRAEVDEVQEANKAAVEKFEKEMMGLDPVSEPASEDEDRGVEDMDLVNEDEEGVSSLENAEELGQEMWADMMDRVEDAMEDDARGIAAVREAIERALEESELLVNLSPEKSKAQVDALLSAITSPDLRAAAESIQTVGIMEEGVVRPDDDAENAEEASGSDVESEAVSLTDSKDAATDSAAVKETAEEAEASEAESESVTLVDSKETAEFSLKDMILGLAARAQTSTTAADPSERDSDECVTPRETMRIKKFERILSEMLSGSKESSDDNAAPTDIEGKMKQADTISNAKSSESSKADSNNDGDELLGMVLTARNMMGNRLVERVCGTPKDWSLAYSIEEMSNDSAKRIYQQVKERRRGTFENTPSADQEPSAYQRSFLQKIRAVTREGKKYRHTQTEQERKKPVYVLGKEEGLDYREVFGDPPKVEKKDGDDGAAAKAEENGPAADEDVNRGFVDRT